MFEMPQSRQVQMVYAGFPFEKGRLPERRPKSKEANRQDNVCVSKGETEGSWIVDRKGGINEEMALGTHEEP
jgi:hypothetical protein